MVLLAANLSLFSVNRRSIRSVKSPILPQLNRQKYGYGLCQRQRYANDFAQSTTILLDTVDLVFAGS